MTHIYVIGTQEQFNKKTVKIGQTKNMKTLKQRIETGNAFHVDPIKVFCLYDVGDVMDHSDKGLHSLLEESRIVGRGGGEEFFFNLTSKQIRESIEAMFGKNNVKTIKETEF